MKPLSPPSSLVAFLAVFLLVSTVAFTKEGQFPISGSLSNRYKARSTGAITDHDLESILALNWGNASRNHFSAAVQGGGIFDLNGQGNDLLFTDIYNSFSGNARGKAVGRLYYAYVNANQLGPVANVRAGRQYLYQLESLYFDGASLESAPYYGVTLNAFAGTPVHLFENQLGFDPGDWLVGSGLQWNPVAKLRLRYDYIHLRDKITGFRSTQMNLTDDLMGGSLWFNISDHVALFSRLTAFSDQVRDLEVSATISYPEQNLTIRGRGFRLLRGYDIRVIDWDAYGIAGTYLPYTEGVLGVTKGLGEKFVVDGGVNVRRLDKRQVASAFNHGYERVYAGVSSHDFMLNGFELSTTLDYFHGEDNTLKNNSFGISASVFQQLLKKRLRLGGGTAYYLYRYNLLLGDESSHVQTYYGQVEGKLHKNLSARARYEFEKNSFNGFNTFNAGLTWNF